MTDELNLVAAICGKRSNHESLVRIGLEAGDFGEAARCVVDSAREQYTRDAELQSVDYGVLRNQVRRRFGAGSMADSVMDFVASFPDDVSGINVIEEYRLLRLGRVSTTLATLLATGQHSDETKSLLVKYARLVAGEEGEAFKPRLTAEDFEDDENYTINKNRSFTNKKYYSARDFSHTPRSKATVVGRFVLVKRIFCKYSK